MATRAGSLATAGAGETLPSDTQGRYIFVPGGTAVTLGGPTRFYKMEATDPDCGSPTKRTWVVTDEPDLTGVKYAGTRCGASPLTNIIIADYWPR